MVRGPGFACDARALVPRSPIAEWIERGFEPWLEPDAVERVLDIGTGGGAIAVACALAFPNAAVDAVDVSDAALDLARENCIAHDVGDRVRLFESDVYAGVSDRYDLIVSNPPYVDAGTMARLDPEYLHEPRIGLEAGADGLDCVRRILAGANAHLRPGGVLVCEVGASRHTLERAYPMVPFIVARSLAGRGRRLSADTRRSTRPLPLNVFASHPTGQFHLTLRPGNGAKFISLEPFEYLPLFVRHSVAHVCFLPG